jgi:NTE family protein
VATGKLGLALGGGGVRGFAHLGVLSVLEREGLVPQVIAGTSMGAIVAGLYAALPSLRDVEACLVEFFRRIGPDLLKLAQQAAAAPGGISLSAPSLMDPVVFHRFFDELIPDIPFEKTRLPVAVVAVDLVTGSEVVYTSGSLRQAVLGSAALPGIFPPIRYDGRVLVDGGWTARIPVDAARTLGADRVVAVEVSEATDRPASSVAASGLDIVLRASEITRNYLARLRLREADLVLSPPIGHILLHDAASAATCARLGAEAAEAQLSSLRVLVGDRR